MSRRTTKRNVGVIGLGIIGRRVADCLRHRGFHVFVWNRTPRPYPNFVGSPAEIAELCDFIQIFVSNDEALLQMVEAMKPSLKAHHVVLAHSTVAPATVREAAEIVKRRGGQLLDAPFTGSKGAAEKGELVYYVAGDDAAYRRVRPVLDASSKEIIEIGEVGDGMAIKVATNMITAATVQIAAEALALVDRAGISLDKFATAMKSNGSNSGTLSMKLPKMLDGDYETQFSVKHMLKDVEIASRLASSYGLSLDVAEVARRALIEQVERGGADDDYAAVARAYFPEPPAHREPEPEKETEPEVAAAVEPERVPEKDREQEAAQRNGSEETRGDEEIPAREPKSRVIEEEPPNETADEPTEAVADTIVATEERDEARPEIDDVTETSSEDEEARAEDEEIGNASTAVELEPAEPVVAPREKNEAHDEVRRGFFSRIFGRSSDY